MLKAEQDQKTPLQKIQLKIESVDDEDANIQVQTPKKSKSKKIVSQKGNSMVIKMGHWNFQEKLKYVTFLENNSQSFSRQHLSKLWKLFKQMSQFINTRDPYQCRSHHQKMVMKFYNIDDMIECLKSSFSEGTLRKAQRKYLEWLSKGPEDKEKNTIPKQISIHVTLMKNESQGKSEKTTKKLQSNNEEKNEIQQNNCSYQSNYETSKLLLNELYILQQLYKRQLLLNNMLSQINPHMNLFGINN